MKLILCVLVCCAMLCGGVPTTEYVGFTPFGGGLPPITDATITYHTYSNEGAHIGTPQDITGVTTPISAMHGTFGQVIVRTTSEYAFFDVSAEFIPAVEEGQPASTEGFPVLDVVGVFDSVSVGDGFDFAWRFDGIGRFIITVTEWEDEGNGNGGSGLERVAQSTFTFVSGSENEDVMITTGMTRSLHSNFNGFTIFNLQTIANYAMPEGGLAVTVLEKNTRLDLQLHNNQIWLSRNGNISVGVHTIRILVEFSYYIVDADGIYFTIGTGTQEVVLTLNLLEPPRVTTVWDVLLWGAVVAGLGGLIWLMTFMSRRIQEGN